MKEPLPAWQRWSVLLAAVVLVIGGGYLLLRNGEPAPGPVPPPGPDPADDRATADPRLTYAGPYRNVHPDVKYTGDAACADCHFQHVDTFREHPMGRSLFPIAQEPGPAPTDAAHRNPFHGMGTSLRVERAGTRTFHHDFRNDGAGRTIYDRAVEVHYAIGSGTHGTSFLWENDGYVWQSPISWYGQKKVWDVSPGWSEINGGRALEGRCLYCHANRVEPLPGYLNRYEAPVFRGHTIGCERCHGPGEKHVALWHGAGPVERGQDFTIVNPSKLPWQLRESVCQQCHLEGENRLVRRGRGLNDFRPGLPLDRFWAVAVHDEEDFKVVNHVEQMYRSQCFKESAEPQKLGCISCHDPHVKPQPHERSNYFRARCLQCHQDDQAPSAAQRRCSVALAMRMAQAQNSCVDCHMPKHAVSDIPHVAGSDHRILRRPIVERDAPSHATHPGDKLPLRLFHRQPGEALTGEERRDLAISLAEAINLNKLPPILAPKTLEMLEKALSEVAHDADAWEAKGLAAVHSNRLRDAYSAFLKALEVEPNRETSVSSAAFLAQRLDRTEDAIRWWQRAIQLNPQRMLYHSSLAILYHNQRKWRDGKENVDRWVEMQPGSVEARRIRTIYWLRLGNRAAARAEFAIIEALKPANLPELRTWWEAETR